MLRLLITIIVGASSGVVISGAVFAFISVIGVVPRLAQRTSTQSKIVLYENAIIAGGIFGCLLMILNFNINVGIAIVSFFGLCAGVFFGCLAVSLAEILDVIPIMMRRVNLKRGLSVFLLALALGKLAGSTLYFLVSGFNKS